MELEITLTLKVHCEDINKCIKMKYGSEIEIYEDRGEWIDIKLKSAELVYALKNEYGHYSVDIGATYKPVKGQLSQQKWFSFFYPKTILKAKNQQ